MTNYQNPFLEIHSRFDEFEKAFSELKKELQEKQKTKPNEESFIDQKQVAELYGVSTVSIWQWEKNGFLKSYRIGNLKRFKYTEIVNAPKFINRSNKK
jgi:predicted DNA-binding transcriptional regulator AlpA